MIWVTWPGLTYNAMMKHLPEFAPATDKGHMKRQRLGIRSTKEKLKKIEYERDIRPTIAQGKKN